MARKTIAEANKKAAVARLVAGRSTSTDEGRRYGVSAQAVRAWRREFGPDIEREAKEAKPAPTSSPAPAAPPAPAPAAAQALEAGGPGKVGGAPAEGGRAEADRLAAARAAAGLPPAAQAPPGGSVPATGTGAPASAGAPGGAPDISDEAIVEMAGNFVMGLGTRGSLFLACRKAGLKVRMSPDLEALCVLTDKEKAALKPAVPFLAPKIRNFIGSNENVAMGAALAVVGMGFADRLTAVGAVVREAVAKAPPDRAAA